MQRVDESLAINHVKQHVRIQRGQGFLTPPLRNHKNIEFLVNTGPEKNTKLPSQHSMLGHHRPPAKRHLNWRFAGGPMMARF